MSATRALMLAILVPAQEYSLRRRVARPRVPDCLRLDPSSLHLPFPRRIGPRPRAGDRRPKARELQRRLELFAFQMEVRAYRGVIMQPREQRGPERVARPDRVDDLDRHRGNTQSKVAVRTERALGAEGDDHHRHALGEEAL